MASGCASWCMYGVERGCHQKQSTSSLHDARWRSALPTCRASGPTLRLRQTPCASAWACCVWRLVLGSRLQSPKPGRRCSTGRRLALGANGRRQVHWRAVSRVPPPGGFRGAPGRRALSVPPSPSTPSNPRVLLSASGWRCALCMRASVQHTLFLAWSQGARSAAVTLAQLVALASGTTPSRIHPCTNTK